SPAPLRCGRHDWRVDNESPEEPPPRRSQTGIGSDRRSSCRVAVVRVRSGRTAFPLVAPAAYTAFTQAGFAVGTAHKRHYRLVWFRARVLSLRRCAAARPARGGGAFRAAPRLVGPAHAGAAREGPRRPRPNRRTIRERGRGQGEIALRSLRRAIHGGTIRAIA